MTSQHSGAFFVPKLGATTKTGDKELIITKNNEKLNGLYLKEISINLKQMGFITQPSGNNLEVSFDGRSLCRVTPTGGVRYLEYEVKGEDRQAALDKVVDVVVQTAEYMRQMESAPQLKADSLEGDYRLLAEFNNTVLAGHPTQFGVQFITWEWVQNRTSLWQGEYFGPDSGSYDAAKQSFAVRSGLIQGSALFTPEQMMEIYHCSTEILAGLYPITDEQQKCLQSIIEQVEASVPDFDERLQKELEPDVSEIPESGGLQFS